MVQEAAGTGNFSHHAVVTMTQVCHRGNNARHRQWKRHQNGCEMVTHPAAPPGSWTGRDLGEASRDHPERTIYIIIEVPAPQGGLPAAPPGCWAALPWTLRAGAAADAADHCGQPQEAAALAPDTDREGGHTGADTKDGIRCTCGSVVFPGSGSPSTPRGVRPATALRREAPVFVPQIHLATLQARTRTDCWNDCQADNEDTKNLETADSLDDRPLGDALAAPPTAAALEGAGRGGR